MKETTRARVAATIGAASLRKNVTAVYDFSASRHKTISASISNGSLSGYDHSTSSYFSGSGGSLDFYDYDNFKHIQLKLNGTSFDGYDFDSQKHFSGTISGNSISLYDHETGTHYNYSV